VLIAILRKIIHVLKVPIKDDNEISDVPLEYMLIDEDEE